MKRGSYGENDEVHEKKVFVKTTVINYDIFACVRDGDLDIIKKLLDKDNNNMINQTRWSGWTLLHRAAEQGQTDVCEELLKRGARINQQTIRGWLTPLHCAVGNGWKETAFFLIDMGAKTDIKNKAGLTMVEYALKQGYKDLKLDLDSYLMKKESLLQMGKLNNLRASFMSGSFSGGSFAMKSLTASFANKNTKSSFINTTKTDEIAGESIDFLSSLIDQTIDENSVGSDDNDNKNNDNDLEIHENEEINVDNVIAEEIPAAVEMITELSSTPIIPAPVTATKKKSWFSFT